MTDRGAAPHPYLAGLVLTGRKVVVVAAGTSRSAASRACSAPAPT